MAKWAEQEERDLLLGVSIGLPYVEMAEILDRSISSLYKKVYKLRNSDKVKDTNARYYLSNKEGILAYQKEHRRGYQIEYYVKNKDKRKAYQKEYYIENREKCNKACRKYYIDNREVYAAHSAKRRAAKLNATPKWADLEKIKTFYLKRPEGHHVDHIIPLQGEKICGLHVLENLQYLTAEENLKKGNRYDL